MTNVSEVPESTIIIGGGLAGLTAALWLAPSAVVLLSKAPLGFEASSVLAQGGIAASVGSDDDFSLHLVDTLKAGDGLCDAAVAQAILRVAPAAIEDLVRRGVPFDRDAGGHLRLGLEAAHSRRRIVHAGGDSSGREIMRALIARVRETPSITVIERIAARELIVEDNTVAGVLGVTACGPVRFACDRVVIATGGIGGLFQYGTNPRGSWGQGLALAGRAGAVMADLEFVQFHPTALDSLDFPLKLISETVRGEGAILVDEMGERFMATVPGAELAPRDIVARAVWRHMAAGHRVFLDARVKGLDFARRFPAITGFCQAAGIDPSREPIPIRPAAHYHMGGIAVDLAGQSSVRGLWACGEVASTGLHGANRLASNSLLEAVVCGRLVAENILGLASPRRTRLPSAEVRERRAVNPVPVQKLMTSAVGVLRDGPSLAAAAAELRGLMQADGEAADPALVGLMIVMAALRREESRGAHTRIDFPLASVKAQRSFLRLAEAMAAAEALVPECAA
ncbi:MAG TPA: L-aspartate oxidase [Methylocella sp.]|nr:L-aspartate oxidase [Methylocella sp.]